MPLFNLLSDEILLLILVKLSISDLLSISVLSKRLYHLSKDEEIWKKLVYKRFFYNRQSQYHHLHNHYDLESSSTGFIVKKNLKNNKRRKIIKKFNENDIKESHRKTDFNQQWPWKLKQQVKEWRSVYKIQLNMALNRFHFYEHTFPFSIPIDVNITTAKVENKHESSIHMRNNQVLVAQYKSFWIIASVDSVGQLWVQEASSLCFAMNNNSNNDEIQNGKHDMNSSFISGSSWDTTHSDLPSSCIIEINDHLVQNECGLNVHLVCLNVDEKTSTLCMGLSNGGCIIWNIFGSSLSSLPISLIKDPATQKSSSINEIYLTVSLSWISTGEMILSPPKQVRIFENLLIHVADEELTLLNVASSFASRTVVSLICSLNSDPTFSVVDILSVDYLPSSISSNFNLHDIIENHHNLPNSSFSTTDTSITYSIMMLMFRLTDRQGRGQLSIQNIEISQGSIKKMNYLHAQDDENGDHAFCVVSPITCSTWYCPFLFTGHLDNTIRVHLIKDQSFIFLTSIYGHCCTIRSLQIDPYRDLLISCAKDGIKFWSLPDLDDHIVLERLQNENGGDHDNDNDLASRISASMTAEDYFIRCMGSIVPKHQDFEKGRFPEQLIVNADNMVCLTRSLSSLFDSSSSSQTSCRERNRNTIKGYGNHHLHNNSHLITPSSCSLQMWSFL